VSATLATKLLVDGIGETELPFFFTNIAFAEKRYK